MTKSRWFLIYPVVWLIAAVLAAWYFQGGRWPLLYGSALHKISRLHIVAVHLTVGTLLSLAAVESFFFLKPESMANFTSVRVRLHHLAHGLTLLAIVLGLVMELIESYPNNLIRAHVNSALFLYAGLVVFSALCFRRVFGRWSWIGAVVFAAAVVNTAHLGGLIQKGADFFYK